jgi:succinoglycan biosynthesis transport protein ExoP
MADTGGARPKWDLGAPVSLGQDEGTGGAQRIVEAFRRRLWVFALTTAVVFMLVAFATLTATRMYTARADIQLDVRELNILGPAVQEVYANLTPETPMIDTEIEIMASRALAARVVDALNLTEDPEFAPVRRPGLLDRVRALFGAQPEEDTPEQRNIRREITILSLMSHTVVQRYNTTYIIMINITSVDPNKAAVIANAFADNYLTMQLETKYETIATAREWLRNRLNTLGAEVEAKERAVEEYRAQSGLLVTGAQTLNEQTMSQLNMNLVSAEADLAAARANLAGVAAGASSAEALRSPVISSMRTQQAELTRQRAELSTRYGPRHPAMLQIDRQVADLQRDINSEIGRITQNLQTQVSIAEERVNSLRGSLSGQTDTLETNNVASVHLRVLERDAETSRALYDALQNRFQQMTETSGIERADARITSEAAVPLSPSSPRQQLNLMLGLLAGMGLGCVAVFIVELLEQSLRTPEDVQGRVGAPCLGAVPFVDRRTRTIDGELLSPEEFILKRPLSAFGEALRSVRAGVFFANPDRKVKVLAVTSALPDEGKTTTAVGLARISALAGSKTVIVDCDLRHRSATHTLGLEVEKGLTEVLFRTASLNEVIQRDQGSGADIVPLAQAEFTPRDLFSSEAMKSLIEALRVRYDVVILDTAPVMPISDTRVLAGIADSVLVVCRWGRTPASVVRGAVDRLRQHNAKIAGVVLEGVETGIVSRLLYDRPDYYSELYQTYYIR